MLKSLVFAASAFVLAMSATAQSPEPEASTVSERAEAVEHPLSAMFGEWRGTATGRDQSGPFELTQTERVGPMLDGRVVVVEGRGYDADGVTKFNALGVISPSDDGEAYRMRSSTLERSGDFPLELTDTGFVWWIELPNGGEMRYTAVIEGDSWVETGVYTAPNGQSFQTFQMRLERIGDTDWPAGDPVSPE